MPKIDIKILLIIVAIYTGFKHSEKINIPTNWDIGGKQTIVIETKNREVLEPSQDFKDIVKPLQSVMIKKEGRDLAKDCFVLGDFYGNFADIIVSKELVKTNTDFRNLLIEAGKLNFIIGDLSSAYPNLDNTLNGQSGIISQKITLGPGSIDKTVAINTLKAIQWQFYEIAKGK